MLTAEELLGTDRHGRTRVEEWFWFGTCLPPPETWKRRIERDEGNQ